MKKLLFISIAILALNIHLYSQVKGGFYIGKNNIGNKYIYFRGQNYSQYTIQINLCASNDRLNQRLYWQYVLLPLQTFTIGPEDGWIWQIGEKLWIQYQNGQYGSWTNMLSVGSYSPIFTGNSGKHCRGDHNSCYCNGYSPAGGADWHCKYFGHVKNDHIIN